jgi:hypothetical protein
MSQRNWLAPSIYVQIKASIHLYTRWQNEFTSEKLTKKEKERKGERLLIITALKRWKEDTYGWTTNAHVTEDICSAAPTVLVNFFIHACCSLLQSAYTFSLHAFCFSTISLHHLLLPSCTAVHRACFSLLCLSTSTTPSLHLPTINLSVLHWSMMSICPHFLPLLLSCIYLALTLEEERQLITRNLTRHNSRWMICQWVILNGW